MVSNAPSRFSIGQALAVGWNRFLANIGPMALYALVVWSISALLSLPGRDSGGVATFLFGVVSLVVGQLISIGWIRLALDVVDGRRVTAASITASFRVLLPYAVAAIIFSLALAVGLVLLVVPGIVVAVVFGFYGWVIVDRGSDPVAALRRSAALTEGERWHLFGFGLTLLALNVLGLLVLLVGVLVTSGVSLLALAHVYRQLQGSQEAAPRRTLQ